MDLKLASLVKRMIQYGSLQMASIHRDGCTTMDPHLIILFSIKVDTFCAPKEMETRIMALSLGSFRQ